jgi:phospholipase A1
MYFRPPLSLLLLALCTWVGAAQSQNANPTAAPEDSAASARLRCSLITHDDKARLACYDSQSAGVKLPAPPVAPVSSDCRDDSRSLLSRMWELEDDSDCGRFNIRVYRPISISAVSGDSINMAPSSPSPGHTAAPLPYLKGETKLQLSVRSKFAQGMLRDDDSLWFAYTQQSYWQFFTHELSHPFRNTDHEPEMIYILPVMHRLTGDWYFSYLGMSVTHQSNGQSLPMSRSWNRNILMAGIEKDRRFTLTARVWRRMAEDPAEDDNPNIDDYIGRGELSASWQADADHTLAMTLRHPLSSAEGGSWRLEWLYALGNDYNRGKKNRSGLRLHTQIFRGYGDSLPDYNYFRTVFSIGLSLVDW